MQDARDDVGAEIEGAPPFSAFAESGVPDTPNLDAAPRLSRGVRSRGAVVGATASHHRHLMAALYERSGKVGGVLRRRRNVRVERLIEKKNAHEGVLIRQSSW